MFAAIGIWVGIGLTLCIYSFLYKDNPFFRFAEHLFVGVSVGVFITRPAFSDIVKMIEE